MFIYLSLSICLSVGPACLPAHLSVDWSACPSVYSSKIEAARTSPPARFPAPHPPNNVMKNIKLYYIYKHYKRIYRTSPPARFPAPHPPNDVMKNIILYYIYKHYKCIYRTSPPPASPPRTRPIVLGRISVHKMYKCDNEG